MAEPLPIWRPRALAGRAFGSGNTGTARPGSIGGMALSILADTTNTALELASDARARQVQQQDALAGYAAGRQAAQAGGPLPTAENSFSVGAAAYEQNAIAGFQAGLSNKVRSAAAEAAAAAGDDPAAFDAALRESLPPVTQIPRDLVPAYRDEIADVAGRWRAALAEKQAKARAELAEAEQRTALASRQDEAAMAARAGDRAGVIKANQEFEALGQSLVLSGQMTGQQLADVRTTSLRQQREQHVWGMFERAVDAQGIGGGMAVQAAFQAGSAELGLPPDQSDRMLAGMSRRLQDLAQADERQVKLHEKAMRVAGDEAQKEIVDLDMRGELTPSALFARRDLLDPTDYRMAAERLRAIDKETAKPEVDTQLYVDLADAAGSDPKVPALARSAYLAGKLDDQHYEKIRAAVEQGTNEAVREARSYVKMRIQGPDANPLPGTEQRGAAALDAIGEWVAARKAANQPIERAALMEYARAYADADASQFAEYSSVGMIRPKFSPEGVATLDLDLPDIAFQIKQWYESQPRTPELDAEFQVQVNIIDNIARLQRQARPAPQRPPAAAATNATVSTGGGF